MPTQKVKKCGHKHKCGCKKKICERCRDIIAEENIEKEDWKDLDCDGEDCKLYYTHRNDNCNCGGRDCGYCEAREEEEEKVVHNYSNEQLIILYVTGDGDTRRKELVEIIIKNDPNLKTILENPCDEYEKFCLVRSYFKTTNPTA